MITFVKKNWGNLIFLIVLAVLIFPQTRIPIQVWANRVISFSPSKLDKEEQTTVADYDWNLVDLMGVRTNLSESKNRVVIINFWATWCPPCIAEMPSFQQLYEKHGDAVDFYFVSSETQETLTHFMEKRGYTFPVQRYNTDPPDMLQITSLPTTFVLSKKGKIVVKKVGAADWDSSSFNKILTDLLND